MDMWLYFEATHHLHLFCNPTSPERIDELGRLLDLGHESRMLDIACGHAELLVRWAEQHGCGGVGVDLSPYALEHARSRRDERAPFADIDLLLMDGKDYRTDERFDVVSCIGASWIWSGFEGTLRATREFLKPGGYLVSGEPYWIQDPPDEYLEADGLERDQFHSLEGCRRVALDVGLNPIWMAASSLEEWDRYEWLQARSAAKFAREHPDHPDLKEILERRARSDEIYLRWGRDHCGFALWIFEEQD